MHSLFMPALTSLVCQWPHKETQALHDNHRQAQDCTNEICVSMTKRYKKVIQVIQVGWHMYNETWSLQFDWNDIMTGWAQHLTSKHHITEHTWIQQEREGGPWRRGVQDIRQVCSGEGKKRRQGREWLRMLNKWRILQMQLKFKIVEILSHMTNIDKDRREREDQGLNNFVERDEWFATWHS